MNSQSVNRRILRLQQIAHARSGDKGNHANVGVIAWTDAGYEFLDGFLTAERVADFLHPLAAKRVERFRMPGIRAFNFLLYDVLAGGASGSLRIDSQGKTISSALLQMTIPRPENWEQMLRSCRD